MTSAEYYKWRYENNIQFRMWERQRNQFKKWLNGGRQARSLSRLVDYSRRDLVEHLESQFSKGMGWHNTGEWHIDHIIPKNTLDPSNDEQARLCWSLSNLRPLWASDNCSRPKDGSDVLL